MNNSTDKEINYSLRVSDNYKKELESNINDIINKLSHLFIEYFKFIIEHIKFKKTNFSRFIIIRGLDTIYNVFNYILLYTKNLELTYFHCQKSFYFYVEFISQISEDEKIFLQLSSRDATAYVYKKTICDITVELKKSNEYISEYTKFKLDTIIIYSELYKTYLLKLINNNFTDGDALKNIEIIFEKLNKITDKSTIKKLNDITEKLFYKIENINLFLNISNILISKFIKNKNIFEKCENKILSEEFYEKLINPDKFIIWFSS